MVNPTFGLVKTGLKLDCRFFLAFKDQFAAFPVAGERFGKWFFGTPEEGKHGLQEARLPRIILTDDDVNRRERNLHVNQTLVIAHPKIFDHFSLAVRRGGRPRPDTRQYTLFSHEVQHQVEWDRSSRITRRPPRRLPRPIRPSSRVRPRDRRAAPLPCGPSGRRRG